MPTVDQVRRRGSTRPATVTSTVDGRDHLVSASAAAVGLAAGNGKSVALCGRLVLAAPLTVPPGPTCLDCETALHRITATVARVQAPSWIDGTAVAPAFPADWFAVCDGRPASGGARVMRWHVASFVDGDTHLAEPAPAGYLATAHCDGRRFRPLAVLPGLPLDPGQICPACQDGDAHSDRCQEPKPAWTA